MLWLFMRKKEQRLWDTMKSNQPVGFWLIRVENYVAVGMPDVYIVTPRGLGVWVELKAPIAPKRRSTRWLGTEGVNPDQKNFHIKAARKGLPSYIVARDDRGRLVMVEGLHSDEINDLTYDEVEELSLANHWEGIYEVLADL